MDKGVIEWKGKLLLRNKDIQETVQGYGGKGLEMGGAKDENGRWGHTMLRGLFCQLNNLSALKRCKASDEFKRGVTELDLYGEENAVLLR